MHTQVFLYYVRTCISFIIALLFTYCLQLVAYRKECIRNRAVGVGPAGPAAAGPIFPPETIFFKIKASQFAHIFKLRGSDNMLTIKK